MRRATVVLSLGHAWEEWEVVIPDDVDFDAVDDWVIDNFEETSDKSLVDSGYDNYEIVDVTERGVIDE